MNKRNIEADSYTSESDLEMRESLRSFARVTPEGILIGGLREDDIDTLCLLSVNCTSYSRNKVDSILSRYPDLSAKTIRAILFPGAYNNNQNV